MYSWQEIKDCFIDKADGELESSMLKSFHIDAIIVIVVLMIQGILYLSAGETNSYYIFFEKLGLMYFAFALADYISYKKVKNYNKNKKIDINK